ncbi:MAG TPA: zinc ABC transporter substrate-binding protein [Clostridia bacterium]|nr:zinc ABC transporter substrate-binding protein [Clostridia bacterium]
MAAILLAGVISAGCNTNMGKNNKLVVAVTIVPQKTFIEAVCGDMVDVVTLIPPGYSPENHEPSPMVMQKFSDADIYFAMGMPVEAASILPKAGGKKVVRLDQEVAQVYPDRYFGDGQEDERDPHIWLSPKRVIVMINAIAREMIALDGANRQIYERNAQEYIKKLEALDSEIKEIIINAKSKKFIIFHPSLGYFADDYQLAMYALEEYGKEATPKRMQELIDLAKAEGIKVIFAQAETDSKQSEAFAESIKGRKYVIDPLSADYINNLKDIANAIAA